MADTDRRGPILTEQETLAVRKALGCTNSVKCRHCIEVGGGFSGERYRCLRCDETYYLDYEDMK